MDLQVIINEAKQRLAAEAELKTPTTVLKEATDLCIYEEFNELIQKPGAMSEAVTRHLMKKHNIRASSTIWQIRRRVERKLGIEN